MCNVDALDIWGRAYEPYPRYCMCNVDASDIDAFTQGV